MRITLTGATGFIGRRVSGQLRAEGHELALLGRSGTGAANSWTWNPAAGGVPQEAVDGSAAIIHLAGEPVAQRWTPEAKAKIRASRVDSTRKLIEAMSVSSPRPEVFICASAIGYYGDRGDEVLTESAGPGEGFLSGVCVEWERTAELAAALGIRVVKVRIGVVLGRGGGALAKMLPPFRAGVGGKLAGGRQWMSWIHLEDVARLVGWAVSNSSVHGPVNATAPQSVINAEFTQVLAKVLRRPAIFPVPAFALELLYGEMAEVLTGSQRVVPEAVLGAGFSFRYGSLEEALREATGA